MKITCWAPACDGNHRVCAWPTGTQKKMPGWLTPHSLWWPCVEEEPPSPSGWWRSPCKSLCLFLKSGRRHRELLLQILGNLQGWCRPKNTKISTKFDAHWPWSSILHNLWQSIFRKEQNPRYQGSCWETPECKYCGYQYKNASNMMNHIEAKHMSLQYNCDLCGKVCTTKNALNVHRHRNHRK